MTLARINTVFWAGLTGILLAFGPRTAIAQSGTILGSVESASSGAPVDFAQLLLREAHRSTTTGADGEFLLRHIPAGAYTLQVYRIGFLPLEMPVEVVAGDTVRLELVMRMSVIQHQEVVVEGARAGSQVVDAALELEGERLRQHLGTTIAETLEQEPGLSMRSMGPAPARPVLRGLGGERLLVLEDGGRTGDLSQTSSDHALVIDPVSADRIEIVRGPAALIYGSNTLAGVVNVVHDFIASQRPDRVHLTTTMQAQSVNEGAAIGAAVSAPLPSGLVLTADGVLRTGGDVRTPEGRLRNTQIDTQSGSVGLSAVRSWGYIGLAGSLYNSGYGIPGGFVGAHPNGVSIDLDRQSLKVRAEVLSPLPSIRRLQVRGSYVRFHQQEFESNGSLGIEFGVVSAHAGVTAFTSSLGSLATGAVGVWFEFRDYVSGGFSSTPATQEWTLAGFGYQDVHLGRLSLLAGIRYDLRRVSPVRTFEADIGLVRERDLGGFSASMAAHWPLSGGWSLGMTAMRALRLPGIEELFSEGPHLAAYSFDVGNPDLDAEHASGLEAEVSFQGSRLALSATAYANRFSGYIFPRNTGELNTRIYLPIYQFSGADARMVGAEGQFSWRFARRWSVASTTSYVQGTFIDSDEPIPWMPPFRQRVELEYEREALTLGAALRGAARQDRLGPFEESTDGYLVPDVFARYFFSAGGGLHTLSLSLDNATDTAYRDHLSRVKSIMPEPGLNVRLVYRAFF